MDSGQVRPSRTSLRFMPEALGQRIRFFVSFFLSITSGAWPEKMPGGGGGGGNGFAQWKKWFPMLVSGAKNSDQPPYGGRSHQ